MKTSVSNNGMKFSMVVLSIVFFVSVLVLFIIGYQFITTGTYTFNLFGCLVNIGVSGYIVNRTRNQLKSENNKMETDRV